MPTSKFHCQKCNNHSYTSGEIRTTGGFWTKIFNIQNRKFTTISFERCGFTEMYNAKRAGTVENILDFFTN